MSYLITPSRIVVPQKTTPVKKVKSKQEQASIMAGLFALDYLLEGVQIIGYDWKFKYVNEALVTQSKHHTKREILGMSLLDLYPGIEYSEMFQALRNCMLLRESNKFEAELSFTHGNPSWFEMRVEPIEDGLMIFTLDITERKKSEDALKKLNENLEEKIVSRTAQLQAKNKDIMDSLNYARKIQQAFLPKRSMLMDSFIESMVIYQPKDVVSGDFYWLRKDENYTYLAVADCTGHGVPGALVSMIGMEQLNNLVLELDSPAKMLENLNEVVSTALRQNERQEGSQDGMDIALCSLDQESGTLHYSGANRPLWIIRKGSHVVEEYKPVKRGIGYKNTERPFESLHIQLERGDSVYLFTDGFADTFGGKSGKKLSTRKFKELLLSIQYLSLKDQEFFLKDFIEKWKGGMEQIDDILVLGFRW